jgi:enoyl-CoA hydratase/carnithine racemase
MARFISTERREAIALVTIDNPPLNALSSELLAELETEVDSLDADAAVRAIVLRGAGDRAFVAGADIREFPALREASGDGGSARGIQRLGHRMDAASTPFVGRSAASASAAGSSSRCAATSGCAPTTQRSASRRSSSG